MTSANLIIGITPTGKYKVYFWGKADGHVSDWRGCNFRYAPVDGQPMRGFTTEEEAEIFALAKFQTEEQVSKAANRKPGTHLSDEKFDSMKFHVLNTKDVQERIRRINRP